MTKHLSALFGMILLFVFSNNSFAETLLKIKLKSCQREGNGVVICNFKLKSPISRSMSLTGGQYTQAVDSAGVAYDATEVTIGKVSGLAINFEIFRGVRTKGSVVFEDVDPSIDKFDLITMRFDDGLWKKKNIKIRN